MWSDVLTKPKQGVAFKKDRAQLMNCEENYDDDKDRQKTNMLVLPKEEGPVDPGRVSNDKSMMSIG